MSRCFPFPPPGYEIKARPDDVSFIIKEKDKQKKHKDKKDKKKKDRSERKEKEKSEGKHKEDKEKEKSEGKHKEDKGKEKSEGKHKEDKDRKHKKHKDKKDRKTDTLAFPEEKKIVVGSLHNNQKSEKLVVDRKPNNGVNDYRVLVELGKRVRDDGGATNNQAVHKITLNEQRKFNSGDVLAEPYDDINNKREQRWMANGENQIKVKDKNKNKNENEIKDDVSKGDGCKNEDEHKNRKAEEKKRKKEKKKEKKKERSKEKIKQGASDSSSLDYHDNNNNPLDLVKESCDSQGKLPKHKEPVANGFLHDNRTRPNSSSRPVPSSHQVSQNGIGFCHPSQTNKNMAVEKGAAVMNRKVDGMLSSSPQSVIKNVRNMAANSTTTEHRKAKVDNHVGRNGLNSSHVVGNEGKLEKIINNIRFDEKFPTPHTLLENGRKIPDPIHKPGNKESSMNGLSEGKIDNSSRSSSASVEVKEKTVSTTSMKPPHPDSKYLSQILTVPTVELPQCDDQDWLFGYEDWDSRPKRPRLGPPEIEETKHVWAEAVQVKSADVIARPYVIPY